MLGLTLGGDAAGTERIRVAPGARRVDHGPGEVAPDCAVAVRDREHERLRSRARGSATLSAPCRVMAFTLGARLDDGGHRRRFGKRLEVGLVEVRARRHRLGRAAPASHGA